MRSSQTIDKNEIDKIIKSFYTIEKNGIKENVSFFLTSNDFESLYNAIVRQQHMINIIVNIAYKNFFLNMCLIFLSIYHKSFDDNKVFGVNAFDVR